MKLTSQYSRNDRPKSNRIARCGFILCMTFMSVSLAMASPQKTSDEADVGGLLPSMIVKDQSGKAVDLRAMAKSGNGLIIAFHSTSCPISKQYGPTLVRLEKEFREKGLTMVIVNPHGTDKQADIEKFRAQFPADLTYIWDKDDSLSNAIGARSTTEVFLIDTAMSIRYRGGLDDQFTKERILEEPKNDWLRDAIVEMLRNERIVIAVTDPSGCLLETRQNITLEFKQVTYNNRISRIIQQHCLECHRKDGLGPFSLETYEDVKDHKSMVRMVTKSGEMPPWFADPNTPKGHPGWSNDRSLTASEKRDLINWLSSNDLAKGDATDAPVAHVYKNDEWDIGKPDRIFKLEEPIQIPAQGKIKYQVRTIQTNLEEDTWVNAIEVRPTDHEVVHHALVYVLPPKHPHTAAELATKSDFDNHLVPELIFVYGPGDNFEKSAEGYGKLIRKGSRLRFQIHYTAKGEATSDQLMLGIKIMKTKPKYLEIPHAMVNLGIKIPAADGNHMEKISQLIPFDISLLSIAPHMHYRGKSIKYELIYPDQRSETLLFVPKWNFEWQLNYQLAKPIKVPKGSHIQTTAIYDNSSDNIDNPDPTKTITWGPESTDEMLVAGFVYIADSEANIHTTLPAPDTTGTSGLLVKLLSNQSVRDRMFRFIDSNGDKKISRKEMDHIITFSPDLKDRPDRIDNLFELIDLDEDAFIDHSEFDSSSKLSG